MKPIRSVVLIAFITVGVFGGVLYTSCSKDACKAVTCQNGGTCSGGLCTPCPNGVGGLNCEIIYRQLYANSYSGSGSDDSGRVYINNTLAFMATPDTNYTKMTLTWTNPGIRVVKFAVTLTNNSSTGSNFTLASSTVDTNTYTGTGSVNSTVASVILTETHPHSTPVLIYLNNFNKQ